MGIAVKKQQSQLLLSCHAGCAYVRRLVCGRMRIGQPRVEGSMHAGVHQTINHLAHGAAGVHPGGSVAAEIHPGVKALGQLEITHAIHDLAHHHLGGNVVPPSAQDDGQQPVPLMGVRSNSHLRKIDEAGVPHCPCREQGVPTPALQSTQHPPTLRASDAPGSLVLLLIVNPLALARLAGEIVLEAGHGRGGAGLHRVQVLGSHIAVAGLMVVVLVRLLGSGLYAGLLL
mmetsp:Transcript_1116/g.2308  ORF Transcript_1116/g.2308 Transcript_1116/m.2308 type:complete len:229 (+) Transcript_1116:947-1633(+)